MGWLSGKRIHLPMQETRDASLIPWSGRSPGGGNGNPFQYSWEIPWTEEPSILQFMVSESDTTEYACIYYTFVVQLFSRVQLFATPWTAAPQASLSFTITRSFLKLISIESMMQSNHLILCCPLLLWLSIFPSISFFPMSWLFESGGQSTGASNSASVLPMNIQGSFPLGLTGFISLQSKGLSRSSPAPQLESINSSAYNTYYHVNTMCLLACMGVKSLQSCQTLCNPMDYSPPGSSVPETLQARILEWVTRPSSRGSSQPRDLTHFSYISCIGRRVLYHWHQIGIPVNAM